MKPLEFVENLRSPVTGPKTLGISTKSSGHSPVTLRSPEGTGLGLKDFVKDCLNDPKIVDVFSYALASFENVAIDEAMTWVTEQERLRDKFPRMEKENQAKILFYACVGRSLGFK